MSVVRRGGRVRREREIGELFLRDIDYPDGSFLESHHHARPYVSVLLNGSYTELCDGLPRACGPGTVIVHPRRERHSDYFTNAGRCINIDIPSAWIRSEETSHARRSTRIALDQDERIAILNCFGDTLPGLASKIVEQALRDLTSLTRAEETGVSGDAPPWLSAVLFEFPWIEAVPFADAALGAGVHQTHFARAFRKHVGMSAGEYRKRARLRHASQLLLASRAPLVDIANAAGFSDQSHFANAFRSLTGMAPGAYRLAFCG